MFTCKLQGSHEEIHQQNIAFEIIEPPLYFLGYLRSVNRIFHRSNNPLSATGLTTFRANCFPSSLIYACSQGLTLLRTIPVPPFLYFVSCH